MCFGGGAKAPSPTPPPAPAPIPTPSDIAPTQTSEQRQKQVSALRYGMLSTIKSGPQGATGAGPELSTPTATGGKKTLGS